MESRAIKWWGWGWEDKTVPLETRPALLDYLRERLKLDMTTRHGPVPFERIPVAPSLLSPDELDELRRIVGEENVASDDAARVMHAAGKGYKDLVRLRTGLLGRLPDVVVFPEDDDSVRRLLEFARRRRYAVIPFGGGTSVVSGLDSHADFAATIVADMRRMRQILSVDVESGLVTAEAGIRGPQLEEALNAKGLTLGHFPQSWEFSTMGGWIATRATGALSNRYGSIEDLVVGLRLVSPTRVLDVRSLPKESHGPSLKELVLGSEGALGIVTQATLRAHPMPAERRYASRLFPTFAEGIAALRAMARDDALPDMAYLGDSEETRFAAAGAGIVADAGDLAARRLAEGSLLLMEFEGTRDRVVHRRQIGRAHV